MNDSPSIAGPMLLTAREAAARLNISEKTLMRLTAPKGTLPVVRIGKRGVRYTPAAIDQWIREQQAASLVGSSRVSQMTGGIRRLNSRE